MGMNEWEADWNTRLWKNTFGFVNNNIWKAVKIKYKVL